LKTSCFIHCYSINNFQEILDYYFNKGSEFFNFCDSINLCYEGDQVPYCNLKKVNIIKNGNNDGEYGTLSRIEELSKVDNGKILYIHTKGVTNENPNIRDWREYMFYFNCERFRDALATLDTYDTYGVDFKLEPVRHYSGNFWWANSSYLRNLKPIKETFSPFTERHKNEFWIGSNSNGKNFSAHDCGISVFERHLHAYPRQRYEEK
jgi:hypothetical protein